MLPLALNAAAPVKLRWRREGQCSQVNDLGSQVDASQVDCWI